MIESVTLGRSDLRVSRLGFGCWQLGGHGWQDIDQREIVAAIHLALDEGVNFFDTADVYGLGASERLLGEALLGKSAVIATKFGVRETGGVATYDNSRDWLSLALEASLKRLGRDTIDLYQLHWHDGKRPIPDILEDLERWRSQGKIRWYGISNIDPALAGLPQGLATFTLSYNLVQRGWEQAIAQAEDKLGFMAWGALAQGLLSGKYRRSHRFAEGDIRRRADSLFASQHWNRHDPLLATLSTVANASQHSMAQTALRWVLDAHPGSVVLTGIKTRAQLSENTGALGWTLPASERAALEKA
ncbi:MAG: aldo/keto reductase [Pseudomonadota bacterium]|nr:aldo/keto reductase [Pseudomonadota bacterium]MDE3038793.1 aldo/keto reductase [Pseudomonadota bacterium]